MEKEGPVISTLNSRRLFIVLIVILALALVACERPLQEEETAPATEAAPEVPEEQQPETGGETGVDAPPTLVPTEAAQPADGSGEQPAEGSGEQPAQPAEEPAQPAEQPAEQPAQPAEQPAQPPEQSPVPTVEVTVAPTGEQVVTVQAGQNLFRIGLQFGCTVPELAAYNGIANPHYIYVGQQIRIPATCGG